MPKTGSEYKSKIFQNFTPTDHIVYGNDLRLNHIRMISRGYRQEELLRERLKNPFSQLDRRNIEDELIFLREDILTCCKRLESALTRDSMERVDQKEISKLNQINKKLESFADLMKQKEMLENKIRSQAKSRMIA